MTSMGHRRAIALVVALLLGCQSEAPAPAVRHLPAGQAAPSWCDAISGALRGIDAAGFECLAVPNFLVTGFFGPERNPERSDFVNACFGGDSGSASRLRMSVRPAGSLRFRHASSRRLATGGGLDLGFLGAWAPKLSVAGAAAESVTVEVSLEDAEVRVLSSVAEILGQQYSGAAEGSPLRGALEGCIDSVCGGGAEKLVYTAKVLAAVPVIRIQRAEQDTRRLSLGGPVTSFDVDRKRSSDSQLVLRAKEKLNIAALLEPATDSFERSRTCQKVRSARARHEALSGLREIGLRALAGRALGEVPTLAEPIRKTVKDPSGAFSSNEQTALLDSVEAIEGAARQLELSKPTNALCATRSLAEKILVGPGEDNRVHGVVADVIEPIGRRLTELANAHALPCAEPVWFLDRDRDGYGDKRSPQRAAAQPPGHVANALDCYDENPEAHPGQTRHFSQHRGDGSFDFDCDGRAARKDELVSEGCHASTILGIPTRCWADPGWETAAPGCGQQGKWLAECEVSVLSCSPSKQQRAVQECR